MEEREGILGVAVVFDLLLGAVGGVGIGDGMPAVPVGDDLEDAGLGFVARELQHPVGLLAHLVAVVAVAHVPGQPVALGTFGEARSGGGAPLARAHRVAVVLDDEHHRQAPQCREVVGLVHRALVGGSVAEEREAGALDAPVFQRVRDSRAERHLAADNAVPAPVVPRRIEEVHRAALALGAAGGLAVKLRHELVQVHADGDGVAVVAIGRDDMILLLHDRAAADGHGLLPDVQMEESADAALLIGAQAALLEAPDAHHRAVKIEALRLGQPGVDRRAAGRRGRRGGRRLGFLNEARRLFAHRRKAGGGRQIMVGISGD